MAKGEGKGLFFPENVESEDPRMIAAWAYRQFMQISAALEAAIARRVEFRNVEPSKPREGDTFGADGTNWNPGAGQGVYTYYNGAWNKLG